MGLKGLPCQMSNERLDQQRTNGFGVGVAKTTQTHFVVSPLPILTKWTGGVSVFVDIVVTGQ